MHGINHALSSMGDGDGVTGGSTPPVSMDDLKNLETSLKSTMDTQNGGVACHDEATLEWK